MSGGGSGDGSSWANAYATLTLWEAQNLDLTDSGGDTLTVNVRGATAETATVSIDGWTTGSANTITIIGDATGKWDDTKYHLVVSGNSDALDIYDPYVTVSNLQVSRTNGSATRDIVEITQTGVTLKNCILKSNAGYATYGINIDGAANSTLYIYNNIIYGLNVTNAKGLFTDSPTAQVVYLYNNTFYLNTIGISTTGSGLTLTAKNNICYNNGTDYVMSAGSLTSSNNLAKDTSSPDNTYDSKTLYFINPDTTSATCDYHLEARDTDAIDDGADLSGTFTTDIDGATRTGTWDIGADEYVATGTSTPPPPLPNHQCGVRRNGLFLG